jgi:hypothetical protein
MAYLSKEERRQRIIALVREKHGVRCPDLVVNDIEKNLGPVLVNYSCEEGGPSRDLHLDDREARDIGLDMSTFRARPEFGS